MLRQRFEAMAVAVAFAERGEWKTSREMLREGAARRAPAAAARKRPQPRAGQRL